MFDILIYLFESYFDADSYPKPEHLSRKLFAAGFEAEEITDVLAWLAVLQAQDSSVYPENLTHTGVRLFSEREEHFIGLEARGFLLFSEQQRLISPVEREMIIDRAVALGQEALPLDQLKLIMLMVLWRRCQALDPLLVEDLLSATPSTPFH
ncbi:MAG: DUF494 domain-containing protein [Gallionella sp.]|jgi:Smg protein|nr:DUF494 domain-containing protein [Gallionella sp.]